MRWIPWCLALPLLCWLGSAARADVAYETHISGVADDTLAGDLHDNSQLVARQDRPPPSLAGLRRRADDDVPRLLQILHDAGYWAAAIDAAIDAEAAPVAVALKVEAGPLYHLAAVRFLAPDGGTPPLGAELAAERVGLAIGGPASGAPVIAAEGRIVTFYAERARPFAKIADRRVVVDDAAHTMTVTYTIDAGATARFGTFAVEGLHELDPSYVERRVAWQPGAPYDQRLVDKLRKALTDSNLFSLVQLDHAAAPEPDGTLKMTATLTERLKRSVGAGLQYSTSLGFGATAFWENRNLFGNAERLRVTGEFAESQLGLLTQFRRPDLGAVDQDLLATIDLADEVPIAYSSRRLRTSSGLERKIDPTLTVGGAGAYEHGNVTAHSLTQHYQLVGLPLYVRYDGTDSLLDPTTGARGALETTPYRSIGGTQGTPRAHGFVLSRLSGSVYRPLLDGDRLVLAGYARLGSIVGETRDQLPADKRFYVGGGGSVRGYGYQLVGPLDAANKPFGGRSSLEFGAELRIKITDTIGLVPFADAGNVYATSLPRPTGQLFYGVGLGMRYYSPVGPIRLDLATPLSRRPSDSIIQVYVSLGQAF